MPPSTERSNTWPFFNNLSTIAGDRKYLSSTESSKMSDNEHAGAGLGHSEALAVKHLPLDIIPQLPQGFEDDPESESIVGREQTLDVLKEKHLRSLSPSDSAYLVKYRPASVLEAPPLSSDREALARKSRTEAVVIWDFPRINPSNVSCRRFLEAVSVDRLAPLVDLTRPDALMTSTLHPEAESSYARDPVDEPQS